MENADGEAVLENAAQAIRDGRPDRATEILQAALQVDPTNRDCLAALANVLRTSGRRKEAFSIYNRLIALGDVSAATWNTVGEALVSGREYAQAVGFFRESLSVEENAGARHNLGQALFKLGEIDEAVEHLEAAARASGEAVAWTALASVVPGAPGTSADGILALRRDFADWLAASPLAAHAKPPTPRHRMAGERIRIGYVSSWFTGANYMKPVWALINNHDRSRLQVHLFSDSPPDAELVGYDPDPDDRLHSTGDLDNTQLAEIISGQGIDVLIDLNAYSTPRRLGLFTAPPAPVTAGWFNMYATSGLPGFHYIIGDDEVVKPGEDAHYSETVLRLPMSYLTFITAHRTPPVVDPPCLANGHITFGSLITQYKMTGQVIAAWANILNDAPTARLFLANRAMEQTENRNWLAGRFAEHGVDPDRIDIAGGAPHYEYLKNYDRMDFALDAFPYNGGTTTMEAIWQGVPVLTFDGDRWASRTSQTLLKRTHLGGYVAESCQAMVAQAIRLASDPGTPAELQRLRHAMRGELEHAPVCDAPALARAMEELLEDALARAA